MNVGIALGFVPCSLILVHVKFGYFWVVGGILNLWIQQLSISDTTEPVLGVFPRGCVSQAGLFPRGCDSQAGVFPRGCDSQMGLFP